jgi:UDP-hydrolysing UDP-N-acetyl-D-glucosamine 2-epimerase
VRRLKSIGEPDSRIFLIDSPALDKFINESWIQKEELLKKLGGENLSEYALMIHHPILGYEERAGQYFEEILLSLKKNQIKAFVNYPNTDSGNKQSIEIIKKYESDSNFVFFKNLNRNLFVNLMRHAKLMIGNSSSGLLEAPVIPLAVVNVGERQRGRMAADNVVFVDQGIENITSGIEEVLSEQFKDSLGKVKSPHGEGDSVKKAFNLLKTITLSKFRFKTEDPLSLVA